VGAEENGIGRVCAPFLAIARDVDARYGFAQCSRWRGEVLEMHGRGRSFFGDRGMGLSEGVRCPWSSLHCRNVELFHHHRWPLE
jgi:hypothetical protein